MSLGIQDLQAILDINSKINSIENVKNVLNDIANYASVLLNAEGASILLVDQSTGNLHFEVAFSENAEALLNVVVPKGMGIAGYVADHKRHVIVNDVENDDRFYKGVDQKTNLKTKNLLAVPLVHQENSIGVIEVMNSRNKGGFSEDDVVLITQFAQLAAVTIANSLLYRELNDRAVELEILYQISNLSNTITDRKTLFGRIVELLSRAFASKRVSLMFLNEETGKLMVESAVGIPSDVMREIENELTTTRISSQVVNLGKVLFASDIESAGFGRNKKLRYNSDSFISVPVKVKNIPIGVINLSEPEKRNQYTPGTIQTLQTIANQVGQTFESILNYNEKIEHEKIRKEVDIMRTLQNALLISDFREYKNVSVYARMIPAEVVAGDFYDLYNFSPRRVGFVIGDVSGKGLPASLFMAVSRSVIKAYAYQVPTTAKLLEYANRILVDDSRVGMFVTVFCGVIDTDRGTLEYSNAGHNLQFLYRPSTNEFLPLSSRGIPLGINGTQTFDVKTIPIESGDVIISFTDGVAEANNNRGEEFGLERIYSVVREYSAASAPTMVNALIREVDNWSEGMAQWDDITVIGFKIP